MQERCFLSSGPNIEITWETCVIEWETLLSQTMLRILGREDEPRMLHVVLDLYPFSGSDTFTYYRDNLHFIHWSVDREILQQSSYGDASRARREKEYRNLADVDAIC